MAISPLSEDVAPLSSWRAQSLPIAALYTLSLPPNGLSYLLTQTERSKNYMGHDNYKTDTNKLFQGDLLICITLRIATTVCTAQIRVANPTSLSLSLSLVVEIYILLKANSDPFLS
jgi:hypothetical protein